MSSKLAAKEIAFSAPCDAVVTEFERLERIKMRFAPIGTSEIADETRRLVKSGTLLGISIGFMPKPGGMRLIDPPRPV